MTTELIAPAESKRPISGGANVKAHLLNVAERLFAEKGVAETSVRDLTAAAGVNVAAVNYYFGSREELFQQVVHRRLEPLNEARLRQLAAVQDMEKPPVEAVLRALLEPSVQVAFEFPYFARLASRLRLDSDQSRWQGYCAHQLEKMRPFEAAFAAAAPHLPACEVNTRFHYTLGAIHHVWSHCPLPDGQTPEDVLSSLLTFYAAGWAAGA